jgi:hypothetical protein
VVAVDSEHECKAPGPPGLHTGNRILNHNGGLRSERPIQFSKALQEDVRFRFTMEVKTFADQPNYDCVEQVQDSGLLQNRDSISARGCEPHPNTTIS